MRVRAEKIEEKPSLIVEEETSTTFQDPDKVSEAEPRGRARREKTKYTSVSLPLKVLFDVDVLIEEFGYWPSRSAFVREACVEKIRDEQRKLGELKRALRAQEEGREQ